MVRQALVLTFCFKEIRLPLQDRLAFIILFGLYLRPVQIFHQVICAPLEPPGHVITPGAHRGNHGQSFEAGCSRDAFGFP